MRAFFGNVLGGMLLLSAATTPFSIASAQDAPNVETANKEGNVLFYASMPSETLDALAQAFNKKYPNIKVEYYRATSSAMLPRLDAEFQAGRVQADLVNLSSTVEMEELRARGVLASYASPEFANVRKDAVTEDKTWFAVNTSLFIIGYNPDVFPTPPTSWRELLDPKHKGRIGISDPRTIGGGSYWRHAMWRIFGDEYAEKLAANKPFIAAGVGPINDKLISGELDVAIDWNYLVDSSKHVTGAPVDGAFPTEGAIAVDSSAAILAKAPHPNAARLFADFLLSKEGQVIAAEGYRYPVRDDAPLPEGMVPLSKIKVLRYPLKELLTERDKSNASWARAFGL
ncbi:ABC transporter substrate-binding protein [Agrobacterium sp. T29]|uniref:ABC transporter substrate-binding protein n=1 Tax=Agrobacterium sp. T29 TaxID=2580515 RepID=UPI00115D496C|nr:extracellular solute-binding protein [Agrobacterium sp. T29]